MYLLILRGGFGGKGELGRAKENRRTKGRTRRKRRKMKLKSERDDEE